MTDDSDTVLVNVTMPRQLHDALHERARLLSASHAAVIRTALDYYLRRTEPLAPAPVRRGER